MSLFSVMNVANKALNASQVAMSVTSQNIANADVQGYSRKRVNFAAEYQKSDRFGQFGFGVTITSIERLRNEHIDAQIRKQSHELGKTFAIDYALEAIENILLEPSDTGILEYMNKFFDAWENLANNPADVAARTMMQTYANMLTSAFNVAGTELETLKNSMNQEMVVIVDKINTIGREIFNLNSEIALVELGGNSANDSKDRRDQLMRELSELVDFESFTDASGQVTITIDGHIFVSQVTLNQLEVYEDKTTRSNNDGYNQYGVRMSNGKNQINPKGGQLKGVMEARDVVIPKYESQLNELAKALVTKVNEIHKNGYNIRGFTGFDFFDPTGLDAKTIKLSASIATDEGNIAVARGGTYREAATNTFSLTYGDTALQLTKSGLEWIWYDEDDPNYVAGANSDPGDKAVNLYTGSAVVKISDTGLQLVEGTDYYIDYSAGTIQLLHDGYDGYDLNIDFKYSTGSFPGVGNNENAILLGQLRSELTMNDNALGTSTATFDQFYSSLQASLGLDRTAALADIRTREYLIAEYDQQQDSVAGVSLDEEMADLIKYQYTYQAAARIFSTAQAMLDTLLNL